MSRKLTSGIFLNYTCKVTYVNRIIDLSNQIILINKEKLSIDRVSYSCNSNSIVDFPEYSEYKIFFEKLPQIFIFKYHIIGSHKFVSCTNVEFVKISINSYSIKLNLTLPDFTIFGIDLILEPTIEIQILTQYKEIQNSSSGD